MKFNEFQLMALAAAAAALWLLTMRGRLAPESNWPLIFYLAMFIYMRAAGGFLPPEYIYSGVICAMLMRFEFMASWLTKFIRFLEAICLLLITWRCLEFSIFR
jgi:hypothetical protein